MRWQASLCAIVCAIPGAQAALLGVALQPAPDVTSGFIQVNYSASSGTFAAEGFALTLEMSPAEPPPDFDIADGAFNINLNVDQTGGVHGGSLLIGGSIADLGASAPLLTGAISAFGFADPPGSPIFDFIFTVTGGSLVRPDAYPLGRQIGVILDAVTPFSGSFATDYANGGTGTADTARLVPEPGALALLLMGLAAARRRF